MNKDAPGCQYFSRGQYHESPLGGEGGLGWAGLGVQAVKMVLVRVGLVFYPNFFIDSCKMFITINSVINYMVYFLRGGLNSDNLKTTRTRVRNPW